MLTNQFAVEVRWSRQDFFKLGAGYVRSILRRYGPSVFSKTYGMAMNPKPWTETVCGSGYVLEAPKTKPPEPGGIA